MSHAAAGAGALVQVTVVAGTRRVERVLPAGVPVAELVPSLAGDLGLLDPLTSYAGYRLTIAGGHEVALDRTLAAEGVVDGEVIILEARAGDEPPRVYDDVVEAMADVVGRERASSEDAGPRPEVTLWVGVLLIVVGAGSLLIEHGLVPSLRG
jgi:hypothetical protein